MLPSAGQRPALPVPAPGQLTAAQELLQFAGELVLQQKSVLNLYLLLVHLQTQTNIFTPVDESVTVMLVVSSHFLRQKPLYIQTL